MLQELFSFLGASGVALGLSFFLSGFAKHKLFKILNLRQGRPFLSARRTLKGSLALIASLLAVGAGVSWFVYGSLIPGLLVLGAFPYLAAWLLAWFRKREQSRFESAGLSFFYTLDALIQSGISLPEALFQVSQNQTSSYAKGIATELAGFEKGNSLEKCLENFQKRYGLRETALYLGVLRVAYKKGLAIGPFLTQMLPFLESTAARNEKMRGLFHGALGQAGFAAAISWVLTLCLGAADPSAAQNFLNSSLALPTALGALALQGVGFWRVFVEVRP